MRLESILRHRNPELLALLCVQALVLLGTLHTYSMKVASVVVDDKPATLGPLIDLNRLRSSEDLRSLWPVTSQREKQAIADRLVSYIDHLKPKTLPNVGALYRIQVTAVEVDQNPDLESLKKRLADARTAAQSQHRPPPEHLTLVTTAQIRAVKPALIVREHYQFRTDLELWVLLLCSGFWLLHVVWRIARFGGDQVILPSLAALTGIGFLMMITLRDPFRDTELFVPFVQGVLCGCVVMLVITQVEWQLHLRGLAFIPLIMSFGLSVLLLVFGSGPGTSDAKVNLGPFQPAEAIRLLLVIFLASYFSRNWRLLRETREGRPIAGGLPRAFAVPKLDYILPVFGGVAIALAFFFLQKDLGPALIMICVFLSMYGVARARAGLVILAFASLAAGIAIGMALGVPTTVRNRVEMVMSPWDNAVSGGDQLAASLWALSSGGAVGAGLGLSEASYVPAAHTDLVMSAVGEELGLVGFAAVFGLWGLLIYRSTRVAVNAFTIYEGFLALACLLALSFQILLITSGTVGLFPLSGVVVPFISYGRTAMVTNFIFLGILSSASSRACRNDVCRPIRQPAYLVCTLVCLVAVLVLLRAAYIQTWASDSIALKGALIREHDGVRRIQRNPRLTALIRRLGRGTIFDRGGIPLATSKPEVLFAHRLSLEKLGVDVDEVVRRGAGRYYPLGSATFHLLGDVRDHRNWGASNTAYIERDLDAFLQGISPADPAARKALIRLWRRRNSVTGATGEYDPKLEHDVSLTIDAPYMLQVTRALQQRLREYGKHRGSIVVVDVGTGDALAIVSLPVPSDDGTKSASTEELLDRARFGRYPPGSTFKLVTAIAALNQDSTSADQRYMCRRLSGGRNGAIVRGTAIKDDVGDSRPHGNLDMKHALAVSCNAFFAQLAIDRVGAQSLFDAGTVFGILMAKPNTPQRLSAMIAQAAYGQGEVLATPVQIARLAATIANGGSTPPFRWFQSKERPSGARRVLADYNAELIAEAMRMTVLEGTGTVASSSAVPIAGKTGTAEVDGQASHAWFAGFAPYRRTNGRAIAFSILIENGGYGGAATAPLAVDIVTAARDLGLL